LKLYFFLIVSAIVLMGGLVCVASTWPVSKHHYPTRISLYLNPTKIAAPVSVSSAIDSGIAEKASSTTDNGIVITPSELTVIESP
jgi:hypothetical protein